ncbi:MAG: PHP domain-containing protein [Cytophagaceae bacterium]|nr:PHP domain-containing protein [Gemmatimonadaceae bacterium]
MYTELHCHSVFSLLDGASEPEALVARAKALGMPAIALTDHDDLGGAVRFAQATKELGIGGILGCELTLRIEQRLTHLVVLAESREGYGNIASLITRARLDQPRGEPHVSLDTLARHTEGLFALTGCPRGWVPSLVADGKQDAACDAAATLIDMFGGRVAIEVWDHRLPEERALVRQLIPIAKALGIPWVVTNNVHYAAPTGRIVHDVLSAIRHKVRLDEMGTRLRPNGEWYLKDPKQVQRRWSGNDAGVRATLDVAERCAFRLADLQPTLPNFPLPPGVGADEYLARLVDQGAIERWGKPVHELAPNYRKQIDHELGLVRQLGFAGYFLIVWDIVRFAHRQGILCQGRGSAANSAVCYCLGITAVDPIKLNLLFERFLSSERKEAPDIDIDFAHRDREHVLQYVYERYGREHAAMVCEQITYRGRSAVRDAARVLGFSVQQADVLSALSDRFSARSTADALRAGTAADEMLGRDYDRDPRSDRPGIPGDARKKKGEWTAEKLLSDKQGQDLMHGTLTGSLLREARAKEREAQLHDPNAGDTPPEDASAAAKAKQAAQSGRPEFSKRYSKGYEPYGNANGRDTAQQNARIEQTLKPLGIGGQRAGGRAGGQAGGKPPDVVDSHAEQTHEERRNPTTATRPAQSAESVLAQAGLDPNDRRVQVLPDIVDGLHQAPRHRSIHVGGFVLTAEPLRTVVPIEPASMPGRTVIQWERDDLDPVGLVKIDLLGLGMLTVLQDCLKYIRGARGVTVDLGQLDMTDQAVFDDMCNADTIGVFQVESRAQMNTLPRLKPRCFYDLVVEVALIRPGPIQGEMVHPYLRRKAGEEPVTYPHPSLEPILKRTLGVPLFQEQGMQVAITAAGFTPGEADNLRRAMGHKRSRERMAAICEKLIAGMAKNGIDGDVAKRIYNQINAFADYGFPESHAASFALIVYASAYLRHYYAPEFTAAILNAQPMGFYSVGTLIEDARRHGVEVRPMDLTCSAWDTSLELGNGGRVVPYGAEVRTEGRMDRWTDGKAQASVPTTMTRGSGLRRSDEPFVIPDKQASASADPGPSVVAALPTTTTRGSGLRRSDEGERPPLHPPVSPSSVSHPSIRPSVHPSIVLPRPAVRLGLRLVRGLGAAAREKLELALREGPFTDITDVVQRARLDQRALRALAEAGAFDAMVGDVPPDERRRTALWRVLEATRGDAGPLAPSRRKRGRAPLPPMSRLETTDADYRITGLSLNGHPMHHLRPLLAPNGVRTAKDLFANGQDATKVAHAGLVICRQRPGTAKGFVFLSLEDETGILNVIVTPKRFEKQALLISTSPLLLVRGTLQVEGKVVNLRGEQFTALKADAGEAWAKGHDFH